MARDWGFFLRDRVWHGRFGPGCRISGGEPVMAPRAVLDSYILKWLDDPKGGGVFTRQRDGIRSHNPECTSLERVWLPRLGGVSCPSDLSECESCGITFFWEGLHAADGCPYYLCNYCQCCKDAGGSCACDDKD